MPTVGRNTAAMVVETAWFSVSAMLMPFDRIRVGISSERASQTTTRGPIAKNAMKQNVKRAVSQPLRVLGTGVMSAFSIFRGAVLASSGLGSGFDRNALTLSLGSPASRLISRGAADASSERTMAVADRKPP